MDSTEDPMDTFYEQILFVSEKHKQETPEPQPIDESEQIVNINEEDERIVLEMHIEEILELLCENYRDNIRSAAERGDTKAIICLYRENSKHRQLINIHKLLHPHKILSEKYSEYEIPLLMDRLQKKFNPFRVVVNTLNDLMPDIGKNYYTINIEWGPDESPNNSDDEQ